MCCGDDRESSRKLQIPRTESVNTVLRFSSALAVVLCHYLVNKDIDIDNAIVSSENI